ncbi:hypothetical protein L1987_79107 [Smallanthus sonchifolius]|uniref:Uncharacterized protein n=1 Tax=Smallanthus sonchifolius TaxID=185202 RepID=A0ACB8ZET3_9ASTR|nr:hypothetical protein L1987_79107 [Smallanthus sonchifolius]
MWVLVVAKGLDLEKKGAGPLLGSSNGDHLFSLSIAVRSLGLSAIVITTIWVTPKVVAGAAHYTVRFVWFGQLDFDWTSAIGHGTMVVEYKMSSKVAIDTWSTLLGQHSEWQTHAREEVLHVLGDNNPDIDGLSHLKLMNIIFNEVLRLYSPVALLRRLIHDETKLGSLTLPAGTLIQINTLILHHDKDMWGDDVHEFKPERFSKGVSKVTKGQASYLPFGDGPRICIGQNFAIPEAKTALAMILQHFSFELSPSYTHTPHAITTLQPQFGAHLILHKL